MTGRRMTPDEHFDEIEALGAHIWEALNDDERAKHQIDRDRLEQGTQCVCRCGARCVYWVGHLRDVREHGELWTRLEAMAGRGVKPDAECRSCEHEYRRHLVGLDGCAQCEIWEPEHARCTQWQPQLPERIER